MPRNTGTKGRVEEKYRDERERHHKGQGGTLPNEMETHGQKGRVTVSQTTGKTKESRAETISALNDNSAMIF